MTDEEALSAIRGGDVSALDVLVDRHGARAQHLAYGITRDLPTAQDVVADCFLLLVKHSRHFDTSRPFRPWFNRIVVNRSLTAAKRRRRWLTLPIWGPVHSEAEDPTRLAELGETRKAIYLAFGELDPGHRAVVMLRLVLGMSEAETAQALDCPIGTVKSRLARARRQLQRRLGEHHISSLVPSGECP